MYECEICSFPLRIEDVIESTGPNMKSFETPRYKATCPNCEHTSIVKL